MSFWQFMNDSPFLAFLALCFSYGLLIRLIRLPTLLLHGWPKEPYDADGDIKYPDKEDIQ